MNLLSKKNKIKENRVIWFRTERVIQYLEGNHITGKESIFQ